MPLHRPLSEIDAERAQVAARLNELQIERDAARQAEIDTVTRLFDAGISVREIAREVRQTPAAVQGVLFRSGRTEGGRMAIRQQIVAAGIVQQPERAGGIPGGVQP